MKLHVGAGRVPLDGWTNLDLAPWTGIDIVADITDSIPLEDNSVDEFLASHVIEHVTDPLAAFQELWRVAKPGATIELHVPYGSSDVAWSDPTHLRPYFAMSWEGFSQPYHWRMEQGYTADWKTTKVLLLVEKELEGLTMKEAWKRVQHERNVVAEMRAWLTAIKPARVAGVEEQDKAQLVLEIDGAQ